jgi:hypothetical protein
MSAQLNHTIVWCRDKAASATFLADMLGRPAPTRFGPFAVVDMDNGVSLDFHDVEQDREIVSQHYAFLIGEADFDAVLGRIKAAALPYWADPARRRPDEIITTTAAAGSTSPTPTATSWR